MSNKKFFSLFEKIESYEDVPLGVDLLVWDGCDYHLDYVDVDSDTGRSYSANGIDFIAYMVIPSQVASMKKLGDAS